MPMVVGRRLLVVLALVAGVVLGALPAAATVVVGLSFDDQCTEAERIFDGTVQDVVSRPNPAAPQYFETIVTFHVEQAVVGDVAETVVLRFSGGQVGDVRQSIDGMPEFARGERYVLFTEPPVAGAPLVSAVLGLNQGLYKVRDVERADGIHHVVRDGLDRPIDLQTLSPRAAAATLGAAPGTEPDVDTFIAAIRAARAR